MVRSELTADDSLAAMRARSKFGIAMAAMIRMMATTISNSISEKPFCFRISSPGIVQLAFRTCELNLVGRFSGLRDPPAQRDFPRPARRRAYFNAFRRGPQNRFYPGATSFTKTTLRERHLAADLRITFLGARQALVPLRACENMLRTPREHLQNCKRKAA